MTTQTSFFNHLKILSIILYDLTGKFQLDLTSAFSSLKIEENMFSQYLTATLLIQDTQSLDSTFPILGGEVITFKLQDREDSVINNESILDLSLMVESVVFNPNDEISSQSLPKTLTINLRSPYYFISKLRRISRRFIGNTESIISFLFQYVMKMKPIVRVEDDMNLDFISNFWDVNSIMKYITFKGIDTFFFETLREHVFAKLSTMAKQETEEFWKMSMFSINDSVNFQAVMAAKFKTKFSIADMFRYDGFGNTVYNPNLTGYNYEILTNDLTKEISYTKDLCNTNYYWNFFVDYGEDSCVLNSFNADIVNRRNIIIQNLSNYNVTCNLKGSFTRNVGDIIEFNLPFIQTDPAQTSNTLFKGKWLITSITHTMDNSMRYDQDITICKTGFQV